MEISEMKNAKSKIKNSLDGLNSKVETTAKEFVNLKLYQQKSSNLGRERKKTWL